MKHDSAALLFHLSLHGITAGAVICVLLLILPVRVQTIVHSRLAEPYVQCLDQLAGAEESLNETEQANRWMASEIDSCHQTIAFDQQILTISLEELNRE